jgi:hypothetical protein
MYVHSPVQDEEGSREFWAIGNARDHYSCDFDCPVLCGAIVFPVSFAVANFAGAGILDLVFLFAAMLVLALIGSLLGRGIRSMKKPIEALLSAFAGSFAMGGVLALFAVLNIPYAARINPTWLGTNWYSAALAMFLIGTPIMLTFLVGE